MLRDINGIKIYKYKFNVIAIVWKRWDKTQHSFQYSNREKIWFKKQVDSNFIGMAKSNEIPSNLF